VPAIVVSMNDTLATGSLRSARGYDLQGILDQTNDLFIDWGGHGYAAGFSMKTENWDAFMQRLEEAAKTIEFTDSKTDADTIFIDAELPLAYLGPEIFKLVDMFEPYGKDNRELIFLTRGLKVRDISFVGRVEAKHLKLEIEAGKYKWPALYWNAAEKVKVDFDINDIVDAVFHLERNWFKGNCTAQICIHDLQRSGVETGGAGA
jgi:single-stranded-DNA-specific exonuclease